MRQTVILLVALATVGVLLLLLLEAEFPADRPASGPAAPVLQECYPADGAMSVPRQVQARLTFDQPMDTATLNGAVRVRYLGSTLPALPAMAPQLRGAYDPELNSLLFSATFIPGEEVEITVDDTVRSLAGAAMEKPAHIQFLIEDDLLQAWEYQLTSHPDRARPLGRLFFRDREIGRFSGTLAIPLGRFRFFERDNGSDSGWSKIDEPAPMMPGGKRDLQPGIEPPLTEADYRVGYYSGSLTARRIGTPLSWVHLEEAAAGRWLDPRRLSQY